MANIINSSTGEVIRQQTEQEEQVYKTLEKWSECLNKWEYSIQVKRNKGKNSIHFLPITLVYKLLRICN